MPRRSALDNRGTPLEHTRARLYREEVARLSPSLVKIGRRRDAGARDETCAPAPRRRRSLGALVPLVKALADETRLSIVELLLGADEELCACDVEAAFDLTQPTISHHMRVLRDAGLVLAERRGQWVYYAATPAARRALDALLAAVPPARPANRRASM